MEFFVSISTQIWLHLAKKKWLNSKKVLELSLVFAMPKAISQNNQKFRIFVLLSKFLSMIRLFASQIKFEKIEKSAPMERKKSSPKIRAKAKISSKIVAFCHFEKFLWHFIRGKIRLRAEQNRHEKMKFRLWQILTKLMLMRKVGQLFLFPCGL